MPRGAARVPTDVVVVRSGEWAGRFLVQWREQHVRHVVRGTSRVCQGNGREVADDSSGGSSLQNALLHEAALETGGVYADECMFRDGGGGTCTADTGGNCTDAYECNASVRDACFVVTLQRLLNQGTQARAQGLSFGFSRVCFVNTRNIDTTGNSPGRLVASHGASYLPGDMFYRGTSRAMADAIAQSKHFNQMG
jgi:hypothetical protein